MRSFPALMFMALLDFLIYQLVMQPMMTRMVDYYAGLAYLFDVSMYTR